jgi:hypothetical protein
LPQRPIHVVRGGNCAEVDRKPKYSLEIFIQLVQNGWSYSHGQVRRRAVAVYEEENSRQHPACGI